MKNVTKQFTIVADEQTMKRFERLLTSMDLSASWGHSGVFAMPLDGDGSDIFKVYGDKNKQYVEDYKEMKGLGCVEVSYNDIYDRRYKN